MRRGKSRRDGFSLVEMVIIIGIIGVLVGGTGLAIGLLRSADTKGAAYDINSALTSLKSKTTGGKNQPYLYVYLYGNEYYLDTSYDKPDSYEPTTEAKKIGDDRLQIMFGSDADRKALDNASGGGADKTLCIAFQKKDGAFLVDGKCVCPNKIFIRDNGSSEDDYVICLVKDTGHHYIEGQE